MADDELEYNTFYQELQTTFRQSFVEAQKKCYLICIPQLSSLREAQIDQYFVDTHILKPSPYFQGQYFTTDKGSRGTLLLEENTFTSVSGLKEQIKVTVLSEEIGYNSEDKQFKIFVLEKPFEATGTKKISSPYVRCGTSEDTDLYSLEPSYQKCVTYLRRFPECSEALEESKSQAAQLNSTYMILSGFLDETAVKLHDVWEKLVEAYLGSVTRRDPRIKDNIRKAVESYLLGGLHYKLYPVIQSDARREDDALRDKLLILRPLPPEELGLDKKFSCRFTNAIHEVGQLKHSLTPLDILLCMRRTIERATEAVHTHLKAKYPVSDLPNLTSDDYIPLILHVLAQTSDLCLYSLLCYVDKFHWSGSHSEELSFSFVTFKAVVHYLTSLNACQLSRRFQEKQSAPKSSAKTKTTYKTSAAVAAGGPSTVTVDRQMDRITRMLETSTKDFVSASKDATPPPTKGVARSGIGKMSSLRSQQQGAPLGDFLSSLKDDTFHSTYGKQN